MGEERGYEAAIAENLRPVAGWPMRRRLDVGRGGSIAPRFLATRMVADSALANVAPGTP